MNDLQKHLAAPPLSEIPEVFSNRQNAPELAHWHQISLSVTPQHHPNLIFCAFYHTTFCFKIFPHVIWWCTQHNLENISAEDVYKSASLTT
jgi:hypothetical protein